MSARPTVTKVMVIQALDGMLHSWDGDECDAIAEMYVNTSNHDGYFMAKGLEWEGWLYPIALDVEDLDRLEHFVRPILEDACKAWVYAEQIEPPYPIGTMTTIGEITGLNEYGAAQYLIRMHGETSSTRRRIVNFEDVRLPDTSIAKQSGADNA